MTDPAAHDIRIGDYVEEILSSHIAVITRDTETTQRNLIDIAELIADLAAFDTQLKKDPGGNVANDILTISPSFSNRSYMACTLRAWRNETGPYSEVTVTQRWQDRGYEIMDSTILMHGNLPMALEMAFDARIESAEEGKGEPVMLHELIIPNFPGLNVPISNRRVTSIAPGEEYGMYISCEPCSKSWGEIFAGLNAQIDAALAPCDLDRQTVIERVIDMKPDSHADQNIIRDVMTYLAA